MANVDSVDRAFRIVLVVAGPVVAGLVRLCPAFALPGIRTSRRAEARP